MPAYTDLKNLNRPLRVGVILVNSSATPFIPSTWVAQEQADIPPSTTEILDIARDLADSGKGIIVISSELTELLAVSDRILVPQDGTVTREMHRRDVGSEEELHRAVQSV